ncbi:hypothetical protein XENOCAPTIV_010759 [Xenoophorus captivus]|uniref:Uncharacterized protein n=1 Tax=Xenoophorus captivus TaxID=1517983 RepID=A0ABV0Q9A3_9TELE
MSFLPFSVFFSLVSVLFLFLNSFVPSLLLSSCSSFHLPSWCFFKSFHPCVRPLFCPFCYLLSFCSPSFYSSFLWLFLPPFLLLPFKGLSFHPSFLPSMYLSFHMLPIALPSFK